MLQWIVKRDLAVLQRTSQGIHTLTSLSEIRKNDSTRKLLLQLQEDGKYHGLFAFHGFNNN